MPSPTDSATESPSNVAPLNLGTGSSPVFQIGGGHLVLSSVDSELTDRFRRLYGDCEIDPQAATGVRVECVVSRSMPSGEIIIDTRDGEAVSVGQFMETVFADRGVRQLSASPDGWSAMESSNPHVTFRVHDRRVVFPANSQWRAMAANLAVGLVLRLQHDVIFMHASGVSLGNGRGLLFVGPKAAGKTTTALGVASRGHGFLGDEIVGVRQATLDLVPVLRTISKREGPCAEAVEAALASTTSLPVRYPSGEARTIVPASRLFATTPTTSRLHAIVFLDGFGPAPRLTPISASLDTVSRLTPVTSTLWGHSNTARAFALVKLLSSVTSYTLQLGPPDMTSSLLEEHFSH